MKPKQSAKPKKQPFTDEQIRDKAYQIWQKYPKRSSEDNLNSAINALRNEYRLRFFSNSWSFAGNVWRWTGIPDKKGFDILQFLITASIPLAIFWGTQHYSDRNNKKQQQIADKNNQQQQQIADNKQKDEVLKNYFDGMKSLLLDKDHPLRKTQSGDEARSIARTLTLTTLNQLNNELNINEGEYPKKSRKLLLLEFLVESRLILVSNQKESVPNSIVDLNGADLSFANFRFANLDGANLRGANLRGSNFTGANLNGANFRDANIMDAFLSFAYLKKATFRGAHLSGAYLNSANLSGADIRDAFLNAAHFDNANLSGANLRGIHNFSVDFSRANLSGANLHRSKLLKVNLSGTNLTNTNLTGAKFIGSSGLSNAAKADLKKRGVTFEDLDLSILKP